MSLYYDRCNIYNVCRSLSSLNFVMLEKNVYKDYIQSVSSIRHRPII